MLTKTKDTVNKIIMKQNRKECTLPSKVVEENKDDFVDGNAAEEAEDGCTSEEIEQEIIKRPARKRQKTKDERAGLAVDVTGGQTDIISKMVSISRAS